MRYRDDNEHIARKRVAFDGAAGNGAVGTVAMFAVTGRVWVKAIAGYCLASLTEAAPGGATISLGVTNLVTQFIAVTTALDIDIGEFWVDATPDANAIALPAACLNILIEENILADILVAAINGGTLEVTVVWVPMSAGANVVAA